MKWKLASWPIMLLLAAAVWAAAPDHAQDWTHYVRIAAFGLQSGNAEQIVRDATASNVFGIEVDNDIPGRYESLLDPTEKLAAIRRVAHAAHTAGNRAFVYIAGLECITANADKSEHTLAKDHPDWLQRKRSGEPAIFGSGSAFWIAKGDEDVWISPYAPDWRKLYMERVRQIAATGIDGIYVDIPYWMTHFDGWEDSWASFDDYTVAAFRKQSGLDARRDLKLGDFSNPNFQKWINFRIQTITDFMQEIDVTAKSVNSAIVTIPEIYPGIEEEAVRVGADVYSLYPVVGAIAHEYEFGGGDHMASSRTPLDWFHYQVGMHSFRAFAEGKPTWILNYSWDGDKTVDPREAMQNLAMSQLAAGANFWDAKGHVMSGSNDLETRKKIFAWIAEHEGIFYDSRTPIQPVGVYFSPTTRNLFAEDFLASYRGCLILMMQKHWEFQIVTPRTIVGFHGDALILPDVRMLDDAERKTLATLQAAGVKIIATGNYATGLQNVNAFADCPCRRYEKSLDKNLENAAPAAVKDLLTALGHQQTLELSAAPQVATSFAMVDGRPHIFLANFQGLRGGENAVPTESAVTLTLKQPAKVQFLPFLGSTQEVSGVNGVYRLPALGRGGVIWVETSKKSPSN
jgi:hypothetical protein